MSVSSMASGCTVCTPYEATHAVPWQVANDVGLASRPESVSRTVVVAEACPTGQAACPTGLCVNGGLLLRQCHVHCAQAAVMTNVHPPNLACRVDRVFSHSFRDSGGHSGHVCPGCPNHTSQEHLQ